MARPHIPDHLTHHACIGTIFSHGNVLPWFLENRDETVNFIPRDRLLFNSIEIAIMGRPARRSA